VTDLKPAVVVKANLPQLLAYCAERDPDELVRLMEAEESAKRFKLGQPFLKTPATIAADGDTSRYWVDVHQILDLEVRVNSQWYASNICHFVAHLVSLGLTPVGVSTAYVDAQLAKAAAKTTKATSPGGARYGTTAIGDAQNLFVRYVLGNLGQEKFGLADWAAVKDSFGNACAYCGSTRSLVIDHAVPISVAALGEHRLGNLVPACKTCNGSTHKGKQRYDDYLRSLPDQTEAAVRLAAIESHMARHGYVPLTSRLSHEDVERIGGVISTGRLEVASVAKTVITDLNGIIEGHSTRHG
jgi:hypothetical protein